METRTIIFKGNQTVDKVSRTLRRRRRNPEVIKFKAVDDNGKFKSIVMLMDIALAKPWMRMMPKETNASSWNDVAITIRCQMPLILGQTNRFCSRQRRRG